MTRIFTYPTTCALSTDDYFIIAPVVKSDHSLCVIRFLNIAVLLISLILISSSRISAGEDNALLDKNASMQTEEHAFEIVEIEWDDFSFNIPIPVGETYKVLRGTDVEGGDILIVVIYSGDSGYRSLFLSTRSLIRDQGERFNNLKYYLLFSEKNNQIADRFSQTLLAKNITPKDFMRIEKVCDSDNSLVYQAKVLCDYEQYSGNILTAIGIMRHDSHSYYALAIDFFANDSDEWNDFFVWNKRLAELQ